MKNVSGSQALWQLGIATCEPLVCGQLKDTIIISSSHHSQNLIRNPGRWSSKPPKLMAQKLDNVQNLF